MTPEFFGGENITESNLNRGEIRVGADYGADVSFAVLLQVETGPDGVRINRIWTGDEILWEQP